LNSLLTGKPMGFGVWAGPCKGGRMKKEVLIRIKGRQYDKDDSEEIEVLTVGTHYEKDGSHYLVYEEAIEGLATPLRNMIKVSGNGERIKVSKRGVVETQMIFSMGEKNQSIYHTPYGDMCIGTEVEEMTSEITDNRIFLSVTYVMEVNYVYVAHNTLTVEATEKK